MYESVVDMGIGIEASFIPATASEVLADLQTPASPRSVDEYSMFYGFVDHG